MRFVPKTNQKYLVRFSFKIHIFSSNKAFLFTEQLFSDSLCKKKWKNPSNSYWNIKFSGFLNSHWLIQGKWCFLSLAQHNFRKNKDKCMIYVLKDCKKTKQQDRIVFIHTYKSWNENIWIKPYFLTKMKNCQNWTKYWFCKTAVISSIFYIFWWFKK